MPTYSTRNAALALDIEHHANDLRVTLADRASGRVWGPVPLLELELYAKAEFRVERVREYRIDAVEELADGLHVSLGDSRRQVRLGIWLRLTAAGELSIRLPLPELYEDKAYAYRLFSVIPLPGLMQVAGADSRLLLPLNCGTLCCPAGKEKLRDRFMIYGEQSRWELLPSIPIGAVQDTQSGLIALAGGAPAECECHVATDGRDSGTFGLAFNLRQHWPDPVEKTTREITIAPLAPDADIVVATARRLRRHILDDHGKPTLAQRAEASPQLASLLESYIMKPFHAVENKGIMMAGSRQGDPITFKRVMTFAQAGEALRRIKAGGVPKVHTQHTGFNPSGHDGMWPSRFPIDERLGGEAEFRAMIHLGKSLGFTINVHDNQKAAYRRSLDWVEDWVIHDQWGQPMALGEWGGGPSHIINQNTRPEGDIARTMRQLQALGLNGTAYLDGMANPCYRDYHPRHPLTRTAFAEMTNRLIIVAREVWGAAATECGFLYAAIHADCMCTPGDQWHMDSCWDEWPATRLMDQRVPVWQLAMHDLCMLEGHGLGWTAVMRNLVLGLHPRDEWSTEPGVMPVLTDTRIAQQAAIYDLCIRRHGHYRTQQMLTWASPEPDVQVTTWEDGSEIRADFASQQLFIDGTPIQPPEIFT